MQMIENKNHTSEKEMSFLEHLEELRWHLIRSILAIGIVSFVIFLYPSFIFDNIILAPKNSSFITNKFLCNLGHVFNSDLLCINTKGLQLINITMSGQFTMHIMVSLIAGIIVAFPYIFFEFWSFLKPALYEKERKHTGGAMFFSSLLFIIGVLFGYYVIIPLSVNFLSSYSISSQITNQININSYVSTVATIALASGLIFELPLLVIVLTRLDIISPSFLRIYRKHALVFILILSAIITPPDIFSQILVAFPLLFLYEISIILSSHINKRNLPAG